MTDSLAVGGGVVFPQGSTVRLSGGLSTAAGDLDASAGGTVFEGLPASYCSLGYCPAPHRGFYLTAQSGALRLDHATLTGGEAELVGTGSLEVTNSTVTTAPEAYYDNAIGGFGSSVVVTHNVVQGRIGASSFTHAVIDDNVVTVTGPTSDNLAPAAINVRGAGVTTAADLEVARNTVSGADSGILLSQLRTTVGTGGSVHDNLGSGNNSNAVLMQNVRLDADLDWVAVPSGLVPQPLGYVADYVEVLHHDVVVPADTAVRASQLSVTGGAFDASAGLATITGATQPDAVVYVVSDGVRAGKALLTQATFTGTLYATGTTPQAGQQVVIDHSSVIDTVRSTGVPTTVSDSVVSILQVDNSRYNPAQTDGPTQVRNSRLTLTAQSTSALDLLGVQISGGGLGLGLSDATGQLSCLDVTDNSSGVGVQGHPVTITSSNIRGNTQADVEGNGDLSTDDVYWGQPGGPRPEQVSGSVALHDTNPRSTPAPCAVATPTPPPGVPGPLTSTPGLLGFALSWTAPTAGAPVTGYEVSVLDDQGSPVNQHSVDAGTTQTAVAGLTNGKTYELVVRAFSGAVAGPTSRLLVVLPLVPPPGPVTNVKVGVVGNRASTTWTNPTDAGYSATKVELVRAGSGDAPSTLVDAATTSVGTPALLTDTAYDLVITAHDADGGFTTPVVVHLRGSSTSLAVDRTSVVDGSSVLATAEVHRDDGQALGGRVVNLVGKAGKAAVSLGHCTTAANGRCQVRFTPPRNLTLTAVAPAAGQSTASTSAARSVSVSPRITTATSRTAYTRSTRTTVSVAVRTPQAGHALQLQWWSGHNWYVVGHADEDSRGRAHLPFTVRPGRQLYRVLDSASGGFCTGTSATFAITGQ